MGLCLRVGFCRTAFFTRAITQTKQGKAKGSAFSSREPQSEAESPKQWIIIAPAAPLSWLRETCSILVMLDEYPPFRTREEGREFQADATSI
ncbi:hypothetical protein HMPREF9004_0597 [Schaalia cardiffensis F0333]|uniref:Uncharacterized protein n=1 Tax=Schaalia cardiffensis F0333 TaxID=888050 RepID=N6XBI2_9ACTO|nr:hypothetical protein HMPREF9004_0597 [Schaalia cardiffensis F0333]